MNYTIFWSETAKEDYANILIWLERSFGQDAALKFLDKTEAIVTQVSLFPNSFPVSKENPRLRKAVITKHSSLIYRILANEEVELIYFWDNRTNFLI